MLKIEVKKEEPKKVEPPKPKKEDPPKAKGEEPKRPVKQPAKPNTEKKTELSMQNKPVVLDLKNYDSDSEDESK